MIRTIEFPLSLSPQAQATARQWLESLRWIWNEGLRLCIEFDTYSRWDKISKTFVPCCPVQWEYRWFKDENEEWVNVPYNRIAPKRKPTRFSCPIPQVYKEPRLNKVNAFSLAGYFAHKRHPEKLWLKAIPANFIRGTTSSLAMAWEHYKKGDRGQPRFKGKGEALETLVNNDASILRRDGDFIRIPNLGQIEVKHLTEGLGDLEIKVLKICNRPSGWYVQVTVDRPLPEPKPTTRQCSIALVGSGIHHSTDVRSVAAPQFIERELKKLERLQRKLQRQEYLSSNWQKTKLEIGKIHEKVRMRRRNFNHKLSTYIVRTYGKINIQKVKVGAMPKPKPKVVNGEYVPNGAANRAIKNRYLTDLGQGQFVALIKQKAKDSGREVKEVTAPKKTNLTGIELAKIIKDQS